MTTVYEALGGEPAMDAAVDLFYRKVLADDHIAHFFEGVDMQTQAQKQKAFLTMVTGGPNDYTGRDMRTAHARLVQDGLTDSHFDHVVDHLGATLKELGVSDELIGTVAEVAESVRDDILGR